MGVRCCRIVFICCVFFALTGCIRYTLYGTSFDVKGAVCDARTGQPLPDVELSFVISSRANIDRRSLGRSDTEGGVSGAVRYKGCEKDIVPLSAARPGKRRRTLSVELSLPGYTTQSFPVDEDTLPQESGTAMLDLGTVKLQPKMAE